MRPRLNVNKPSTWFNARVYDDATPSKLCSRGNLTPYAALIIWQNLNNFLAWSPQDSATFRWFLAHVVHSA